ncbi:MAG: von Willebrand factor type A domain-containing protein [Planctomycetota bacterium]
MNDKIQDESIREDARDPRHEMLCKVVFGEATADEIREIETALETSAALREQKAELESTLALVRGAYGESASDELSSDRFDAVLAAAGTPETEPAPTVRAWYQGPAAVALTFAAASLAIAGVWWSGLEAKRASDTDVVAGLDEFSEPVVPEAEGLLAIGYSVADDSGDEARRVTEGTVEVQLDQDALRSEQAVIATLEERVRTLDLAVQDEKKARDDAFIGYSTTEPADSIVQFYADADSSGDVLTLVSDAGKPEVQTEAGRTMFSLGLAGVSGGSADAAVAPTSPSPGGPSTPAASTASDSFGASRSTPPAAADPVAVPGLGGAAGAEPTAGVRFRRSASPTTGGGGGASAKKASPPASEVGALHELGYAGGSEEPDTSTRRGFYDGKSESSDDFFLGRGAAPSSGADEMPRGGRTTYRVIVPPKRLPNERPRDMFFRFWGDNPFVITDRDAQSTFAADVDTASFTLARRMLREGFLPPREQVRTEEFVNFARADMAPPTKDTFALHGELAPSPFGGREDRWLLRVGLRAAEIDRDQRPALALTFVVDTSGSMKENNRLELVKHAMRLLVGELDARDSIAIVRFSNQASEVLPPTSAAARDAIETALFQLQPDGSTNAEAGLKLGYGLAERTLAEGVQTRVVFLSDGVANVGQTDQDRIAADVAASASRGIFLNTIGVGLANHNDVFLEQMANEGQGVCDYVGDAKDARRAIVERFVGSFVTVAKDVKIQVEFDPQQVLRWRQLGYENRAVADRDFRNDAVDAGEIGAGHQVACLYEIELPTGASSTDAEAALATLRVRWKPVATGEAQPLQEALEIERSLGYGEITAASFRAASQGFRRAALSAQLAECLRRSTHARGDSMEGLGRELAQLLSEDRAEDTATIADMTKRSIDLGLAAQIPAFLVGDPDAAHRQAYYDALIESLGGADDPVPDGSDAKTYESRIRDLLERDRTPRGH